MSKETEYKDLGTGMNVEFMDGETRREGWIFDMDPRKMETVEVVVETAEGGEASVTVAVKDIVTFYIPSGPEFDYLRELHKEMKEEARYKDSKGKAISAGSKIKHLDGTLEKVYRTEDETGEDLGISAMNPDFMKSHPNYPVDEYYSLSSLNLKEWELEDDNNA